MKAEDSAHLRTNRSLSVEPLGQATNYHETPKKNRPDYALVETVLDLALLAGFITAMGVLVRLAF